MWKFVKSTVAGNCELFGVNIFDYKWENTGQEVNVTDPLYNEHHLFDVYRADLGKKIVLFAAGEFSNGIYGFYIKE